MMEKIEVIGDIRNVNLKLHEVLSTSSEFEDNEYTSIMLKFVNSIDGLTVKIIEDISDFNYLLDYAHDFDTFLKFYNKVSGINGALFVKSEIDENIKFIEYGGFQEYMKDMINKLPNEETIRLNKYLMKKIYSEH